VKWILGTGIAVAVAVIAYAWYRGGESAETLRASVPM